MRPVLCHLGGLPVYAYSASIVLGYVVCLAYGVWQAKKQGQDPIHAIDASVWIFVGGFMGARILYVIVSWKMFSDNPLEIFKLWNGGFVYYGGFFGGIVGAFIMIYRRRLDFWLWADLLAPAGLICLIFGRIGCFLNGCCYGTPSDLPWAVIYPPSHPGLGLAQLPVHPAPLYESLACLAISLFLIWRMPRKAFGGEVIGLMAALYSAARFAIEFVRADPRGFIPGLHLSISQAFSILTFAGAMVFLGVGWSRTRAVPPAVGAAPGPRPLDGSPGREAPSP